MAALKACIEAKCRDCGYDPQAQGTWRQQIFNCNVKTCALWPVRPVPIKIIAEKRVNRKKEIL